ncbi:glycerate kinase [Phormidium sp. CLA17]|uniref:glycerate kinase n=1 Tax=Leptolyngbya sp. Cla-17 TaxID=2803751 RepID=UPI001491FD20|nr:glycerate kinase [Leptolyngbya sp. Cla-17]MBM0740087.1 glycerate kinase [Leptolyngbya sp. Cla-17]
MLEPILNNLVAGNPLEIADWRSLEQDALADKQRAEAFDLSEITVKHDIQRRAVLLRLVYPEFRAFCQATLGNPADFLTTLWRVWLPIAQQLANRHQQVGRPFVQGILGGQGTGKTTLSKLLTVLLRQMGLNALNWSLDDLYKTFSDRQRLQAQDPRLVWRGPPGTHDVALGIETLDLLCQSSDQIISIPRFDKSLHNGAGDRATPEQAQNIDIILFEGWFVGVQPIDSTAFDQAPPPILTEADRAFARDINARLQAYLPLWQRLDSLWVLNLSDYRLSKQWRKQAEQQMRAAGKPGMGDAEIDAFVDYFWRSLHPALFMPTALKRADLIIELQPDHSMGALYRITGAESPLVGDSK